jgi:hypothetical protein
VFESTSPDGVHWELVETTAITFDKVSISMENDILDKLVQLSSSIINSIIKNIVVPVAQDYFNNIVNKLNYRLANNLPFDFDVPIGSDNSSALNLTMTTAPALVKGSDLVTINFDGLIDKLAGGSVSNEGLRGDIKNYAPRLQHSNNE